nr:hypothetical protein [Desulfobacteraceae bacterium]
MGDNHINIFYPEYDEGYIADIFDLDAYSAFGLTPDEALQAVKKAKALSSKAFISCPRDADDLLSYWRCAMSSAKIAITLEE